jgi:hypothetical protein
MGVAYFLRGARPMRVSREGKFIKFEKVKLIKVAVADGLDQQISETEEICHN